MRPIALVDLDDTLFQTLRKCPPGLTIDQMTPIGFADNGDPHSYATDAQMGFISWLTETTHFIPVTARSRDALRRVRLPFTEAVCAHGGMIMDDRGGTDMLWDAHIRAGAAQHRETIQSLTDALADAANGFGHPIRVRVQMEGDIALYPLARHETADELALKQVADAVMDRLPPGWTDHRNSNVIAFLPPFLGKQHAVEHILPGLRKRFPNAPIIGIGDSLSDAPFMMHCDFAMTPTGSQLAKIAGRAVIPT